MTDKDLRQLLAECDSELSAIAHGRRPSDVYALRSLYGRVRKCYEAMPSDSDQPITHDWLLSVGFDHGTLFYSLLIPPTHDGAAIVELLLCPEEPGRWWSVSLCQGVPDDQRVPDDNIALTSLELRTCGQVRRLCAGLGRELTTSSCKQGV